MAGVSLSMIIPRVLLFTNSSTLESPKVPVAAAAAAAATTHGVKMPRMRWSSRGSRIEYLVRAAPEGLSEKIASSIESAKESCAEDPASGECVAAWDEVEELSAASSHARDKAKDTDPLETYCKDNPETDECRTYED